MPAQCLRPDDARVRGCRAVQSAAPLLPQRYQSSVLLTEVAVQRGAYSPPAHTAERTPLPSRPNGPAAGWPRSRLRSAAPGTPSPLPRTTASPGSPGCTRVREHQTVSEARYGSGTRRQTVSIPPLPQAPSTPRRATHATTAPSRPVHAPESPPPLNAPRYSSSGLCGSAGDDLGPVLPGPASTSARRHREPGPTRHSETLVRRYR